MKLNATQSQMDLYFTIEKGSQKVLNGSQSKVINSSNDELVLISAISNCYIKTGKYPIASATDSMYLPAGTILPLIILAGDKVSVFNGDITITQ